MNTTNFTLSDLRCNARINPLGTDGSTVRLSWKLTTDDLDRHGLSQSAYRVRVATHPNLLSAEPDLWDSGTVTSDRSVNVPYAGKEMAPSTRAYWNVRVTDDLGVTSESEVAFWETGFYNLDEWHGAQWISGPLVGGPRTTIPCPYLRKSFTLESIPENSRLYITALGVYEASLNGKRIGTDFFAPGWTDYNKRVQYQVYDVTDLLVSGENVLGVILGDGWYCGHVGAGARQEYGDKPQFLATLVAGDTAIVTDDSWKTALGPILESDMMMGESYDARRELPGWNLPGYADDSLWQSVIPGATSDIEISPMLGPTVKAFEEIEPISDPQSLPNWPYPYYVYDFGQNLVGFCRLKIKAEAGTTVRIRFAEVLEGGPAATTGNIYTTNLRGARCTDNYTCNGSPDGEVWEPRFTFHGFRYAELNIFPPSHPTTSATLNPEAPGRDALTAVVLHSDTPRTGDFTCSDPLINQLQKNIDWGQRGNFLEIPTDCPQRDERLGWTGDAQVFIRTAAWNRDVQSFFHKWQRDLCDAQGATGSIPSVIPNPDPTGGDGGPAWSDAHIICPWTVYLAYGDESILEGNYDSFQKFMGYLDTVVSRDNIRSFEGMPGHQGFGDWLAQDGSGKVDGGTPKHLIGTAFYAYDAHLMSRIARVLGKEEDAIRYRSQFESIRQTFQNRYVTPDGLVYPGTQTAYCLALHFDLLSEASRHIAAEALVADIRSRGNHLTTGFVGSPYLPHVLSDMGHAETAYKLLHQKRSPSYLYAVTQGATTIWERWDGWTHDKGFQDAGMNSFNHYAYGAIGAWLYQRVAGIDLDENQPGYKHIQLRPIVANSGLTSASAFLETVYGHVESTWSIQESKWTWTVIVPPNTTATATFPSEFSLNSLEKERVEKHYGVIVVNGKVTLTPGRYLFDGLLSSS